MVTTIQVSEKVKKELFYIKSRLELATGHKCTLEDAIKWLIAKGRKTTIEERKKTSEELFGIAKAITLKDVSILRKEKVSRFDRI